MWGKTYPIYLYFSVIIIGNSPKYIQSITTMNKLILFASALAVLGLTACEKGLDGEADYMSPAATGQVTNSVLQVRTRSGGAAADEATVAYPDWDSVNGYTF